MDESLRKQRGRLLTWLRASKHSLFLLIIEENKIKICRSEILLGFCLNSLSNAFATIKVVDKKVAVNRK